MRRRQRRAGGFVMAEALVALAIAALTLALLTSASWGLRIASDARAAAAQTGAADWLAARRALQGWASGLTALGAEGAEARFVGTGSTARMIVEPAVSGLALPYAAELRVEARTDAAGVDSFVLIVARHLDVRDARVSTDTPQETELVRSDRPIRLLYLLPREGVEGMVWRYETGNSGLPAAIAVEVGDQRVITARVFANRSAACLAAFGVSGLEEPQCELR
jgi:type II secretory pathway pseudopilin PulG